MRTTARAARDDDDAARFGTTAPGTPPGASRRDRTLCARAPGPGRGRWWPLLIALVLAALPLLAQDDATTAEPPADEQPAEAPPADALDAGTAAGGAATRYQFRLYPDRDVGFRLAPRVGLRAPDLDLTYSPRTPDFFDRERPPGPQFALALELDAIAASGERESAKAQEFRDLDDGLALGLDLQRRGAATSLRLVGRHLGRDDQDLHLDFRSYGQLRAELDYSQIPHHFAFDATSLYRGIGGGRLEIDDAVQTDLQGSADRIDAARRLDAALAGADRADLALRRDRAGVALDWTAFDPVALELQLKTESRRGVRPWSASFGLGNAVEIPWPVDYDSSDLRLRAEYAGKGLFVDAAYRRAEFDNNIGSVLFDNPWRAVDSSQPGSIGATFQSGPSTGLIDLYPDNRQEELTATLVKRGLPKETRIQIQVSRGRLEQDDELVPFTTNTAIVPGARGDPPFDAADPASRPAERAGARFDTELFFLRLTSEPIERLETSVYLRDYRLENESRRIFIPGFVREDTEYRAAPSEEGFSNLPIGYRRRVAGVELDWRVAPRIELGLAVEREDTDREFREVAASEEDRYTLRLDAKPAPWADLRLSYLVAERDVDEYDFARFFREQGIDDLPILPFLRKFDQAARDRDRLQLIASFYPSESVVVGAQAIVGRDDYPESSFGVLDDEHAIFQLDVAWTASEHLSLYGAAGRERYDVLIRGRQWFPGAPSDPFRNETGFDSNSNWTADSRDRIDTVALGVDAWLIPDRLRFELAFSWAETDGEIRFASPLGTPADDLNPFVPADFDEVDDVRWTSLVPELEYRLGERLSLRLRYLRERYDASDFNLEGFRLFPVTADGAFAGALFMGTLFPDFDLDVWSLGLRLEL